MQSPGRFGIDGAGRFPTGGGGPLAGIFPADPSDP